MYTIHCPRSKTGQTIVCLRPGETTTFMAISVVVLLYPNLLVAIRLCVVMKLRKKCNLIEKFTEATRKR